MGNRFCSICGNPAPLRLRKLTIDYFECESCKHLFSDYIEQDNMVGGEHEIGRNQQQNHIRLDRVATMTNGMKKEDVNIVDWGCGHGMLVADLRAAGYNVMGFDPYNPEFNRLPEKGKYHVCLMVEIIEHTCPDYIELDAINRCLLDGGLTYIETGFSNIPQQDGIPLDDYFYIAPQNGHSSIFSHHSLDLLMRIKGFETRRHFDRNTRLFSKMKK